MVVVVVYHVNTVVSEHGLLEGMNWIWILKNRKELIIDSMVQAEGYIVYPYCVYSSHTKWGSLKVGSGSPAKKNFKYETINQSPNCHLKKKYFFS